MTIIVDENILAVLHVDVIGGNVLAAVSKNGDKLMIQIRTRVQVDNKIWDSKDEKSWFQVESDDTLEETLAKLHMILEGVPAKASKVSEVRNNGDLTEMMKAITSLPGMHKMEIPAKEKRH